jgi:uncharacterized protein DUF3857/transglutaminase superfamily protein
MTSSTLQKSIVNLRVIVALMIVAASPVLFARDKMEPVPQWALDVAKTPSPTNLGDAKAVVLFDEYLITFDAQNRPIERERSAVRILKLQGRNYGQCSVDYDVDEKLNYFHAWTISNDGKPFQAMESDFTDHGASGDAVMQFTERLKTVKPPALDPGAVVICETEKQLRPYMSEEDWDIQGTIPIVQEAMEIALPPGGHYAESWRKYEPIKPVETANNHLRWEIKDMPSLDLENVKSAPAWSALAARMSLKWGDSAVKGAEGQWRQLGLWMEQLEEHRAEPTPEITAKTQELIAGAPDLYTKLSRITTYIQKNVRYFVVIRGIGGWQAHYAGDIYRNRYGDCKDKTTLLIAMLQAAGIKAHYFHVDSRRGIIDPAAPSLYGNHMITAIEIPSGENDPRLMARAKAANGTTLLIFDPTDEQTPVGSIRTQLQGAWGNIGLGADSQVLQMPVLPPDVAGLVRKGKFTLASDGSLSGDLSETLIGDDATNERMFLKESDAKEVHDTLEHGLGSDLKDLTFKGYEFAQTDELTKPLQLDLHVSDANYAHSAGPLLLLRPRVVGSHARIVPDVMEGKERAYPIELGHTARFRDSFDISIPDGYVVDETPDPVDVNLDFASYKSSVSVKGNTLHYEREYIVKDLEIPPAKAAEFRKLQSAIIDDERRTAVLKRP